MTTVKVAVVGAGAMGRNHARIYRELPDVELVGVVDNDRTISESVARRHGVPAFDDLETLMTVAKPDAVSICVPTNHHLAAARVAIAHGVDVLVEKPIAYTPEEGRELISLAEKSGIVLMVGHVERFNPAVIALKKRLAEGELGRVFQIDARRQGPLPVRIMDVGVVVDLAVHDLDVFRYITGAEVVRLFAETERRVHGQHEDLLCALLRLSDGAVGTLTINWLTPTKIRELIVTGERGMFRLDYILQDLYFFENANANAGNWEALETIRGVTEGRMIRHVVPKKEPLRAELEAFLAAVRKEAPVPVTGQDGLRALELARSLVDSASQNDVLIPEQRPLGM